MKTIATTLAAAALLSLAACGKKADTANDSALNDSALNEVVPADDNFTATDAGAENAALPADDALDNAADATGNAVETNAL